MKKKWNMWWLSLVRMKPLLPLFSPESFPFNTFWNNSTPIPKKNHTLRHWPFIMARRGRGGKGLRKGGTRSGPITNIGPFHGYPTNQNCLCCVIFKGKLYLVLMSELFPVWDGQIENLLPRNLKIGVKCSQLAKKLNTSQTGGNIFGWFRNVFVTISKWISSKILEIFEEYFWNTRNISFYLRSFALTGVSGIFNFKINSSSVVTASRESSNLLQAPAILNTKEISDPVYPLFTGALGRRQEILEGFEIWHCFEGESR